MFCWHKWKAIETKVLPSMIEQIGNAEFDYSGWNPARKDAIVTYRCQKCGAEKVNRI